MSIGKEKLNKLTTLFDQLKDNKSQFISKWQEISKFIGLEMGDWNEEDPTYNPFDSAETYDNTPKESIDTFCNGIEGYAFGRQIAWFRYIPEEDKKQANSEIVKCLEATMKHNYKVLNSNNFYDESRLLVESVVSFGTGAMWFEDVKEKGRPLFKTLHNKQFFPFANSYGEIDTIIRAINFTKEDAIDKFGEGNVSDTVKNSTDVAKTFVFYQYVAPATKFKIGESVSGEGEYVSIYWEKDQQDSCLEKRYNYKPFVCWRWQRSMSGSSWATECPGINQLSNFAMLNELKKDIATMSQYQARGLWKKTKNLKVNFKPGGVTPLNQGEDFGLVGATGDLGWANNTKEEIKQSIKSAFYVDFFLALSESQDRLKSATEAAGLQDEKSTIMASFFSRMSNEFLEPMHEWLFWNELRNGRVKGYEDPNKILEVSKRIDNTDNKLKIDFISPLYLIQRRKVELEPMEEWLKLVLSLAGSGFDIAIYKTDIAEYIDKTAEILGVSKSVIVSTKDAKAEKEKVAKAQAQQAAQQQALQNQNIQADTQNKLAGAK